MRRAFAILLCLAAAPLRADPAEIVDAVAERQGESWRFAVTLRHGDTGWDDYADGWRVLTPADEVLGTRELLHPHVTEQPFTRSLSGVAVPDGLAEVRIESSTNRTGWSGDTLVLQLSWQ